MNTMIKTLGFASLLGMSVGVNAANVGGVIWDPNDEPADFSMQFNFTQWYTSGANAIDSTVNLAPNFDAALAVPGGLVDGDSVLTGVGEVYSINGTAQNVFCPSCELTTVFGGIKLIEAATQTFDLTHAFINIYVDAGPVDGFPWPADAASQADANAAANGDLWLSAGLNTFDLTGTVNSGFVNSLQTVTGGMAAPWFVSGSQPGGFDAQYGGSAFFSADGLYSFVGNGQWLADTANVPEPASVTLLGLALLGLTAKRRKVAIA